MKLAFVEKIDNATTVKSIAGQTVGVPSHDSIGFTCFNAIEHFIKQRSTLTHGALGFFKAADNIQVLLLHQPSNLGQLVLDAASLLLFASGGFADIDEILAVVVCFHVCCSLLPVVGYDMLSQPFGNGRLSLHIRLKPMLDEGLQDPFGISQLSGTIVLKRPDDSGIETIGPQKGRGHLF